MSELFLFSSFTLTGDRPISRVPPSCFALANKSPFSRGFGSLQICSVHQAIPSGPNNDYWLAGLRQDALTAGAPGVFRELPGEDAGSEKDRDTSIAGKRLPGKFLIIVVASTGTISPHISCCVYNKYRAYPRSRF